MKAFLALCIATFALFANAQAVRNTYRGSVSVGKDVVHCVVQSSEFPRYIITINGYGFFLPNGGERPSFDISLNQTGSSKFFAQAVFARQSENDFRRLEKILTDDVVRRACKMEKEKNMQSWNWKQTDVRSPIEWASPKMEGDRVTCPSGAHLHTEYQKCFSRLHVGKR